MVETVEHGSVFEEAVAPLLSGQPHVIFNPPRVGVSHRIIVGVKNRNGVSQKLRSLPNQLMDVIDVKCKVQKGQLLSGKCARHIAQLLLLAPPYALDDKYKQRA